MNFQEEMLKDITKEQADMLLVYFKKDFMRFNQLIYAFLRNQPRISQNAASLIERCLKERPAYINYWVKTLVPKLQDNPPVGIKRNILRFFQHATIPEEWQGVTTDLCFGYLNSGEEPVAVKVFAMTVLGNLCRKHPELAHELTLSIETQLPYATAGFRSRAAKVLEGLKKKNRF